MDKHTIFTYCLTILMPNYVIKIQHSKNTNLSVMFTTFFDRVSNNLYLLSENLLFKNTNNCIYLIIFVSLK